MASTISINSQDVLLAIDLQADFMPGGALAVDGGDEIVPLVNRLASRFEHVVVTQDWHPPTTRLVRLEPRRREAVRDEAARIMAIRPYGTTIACRGRRARRCTRTLPSTLHS